MQEQNLLVLGTFILALGSFEWLQFFKEFTKGLCKVRIVIQKLGKYFQKLSAGQASGENAKEAGRVAKLFADMSWNFAKKQELADEKLEAKF